MGKTYNGLHSHHTPTTKFTLTHPTPKGPTHTYQSRAVFAPIKSTMGIRAVFAPIKSTMGIRAVFAPIKSTMGMTLGVTHEKKTREDLSTACFTVQSRKKITG